MEKVFLITEDDGSFGGEYGDDWYSDRKVVKVLMGSEKFKIQDLKIEFESKIKANWKAKEKKGRMLMYEYMKQNVNIKSFAEWLKNEKGFKESEAFEQIQF